MFNLLFVLKIQHHITSENCRYVRRYWSTISADITTVASKISSHHIRQSLIGCTPWLEHEQKRNPTKRRYAITRFQGHGILKSSISKMVSVGDKVTIER